VAKIRRGKWHKLFKLTFKKEQRSFSEESRALMGVQQPLQWEEAVEDAAAGSSKRERCKGMAANAEAQGTEDIYTNGVRSESSRERLYLVDGQSLYPKGPKSWSHKGIQELENGSGFSPPVDDRLATRELRRARRSPHPLSKSRQIARSVTLVSCGHEVWLVCPDRAIAVSVILFVSSPAPFFFFFLFSRVSGW
jgi:hypothetical protein